MAHDFVILLHEWAITGRTIKETKRSTRSMGTEIIIISTCSEYLKYGYALGIFHLWIIPRKSTNHRRIGYVWKDGQDRRSKGLYIIICRKKRRKSSLWGWSSKLQSSLRLDSIFIIINLAVKFSSTQLFVCSMSTKEQRKKGVGWRMAQKHDQKRTIWWQTLNTIYWTDLHSNSIPLNFLLSSVSVSFRVLPSFSTTHSIDDAPAPTSCCC